MNREYSQLQEWETDWSKSAIKLGDIVFVKERDSIPAIDEPNFVNINVAREYMSDTTPVVVVSMLNQARAYPLDILMWHEIINDTINTIPIAVTYCPLCSSEFIYSRKVHDKVLTLEVSGLVRYSNLVMIDKETDTLWQQITGKAIVGDLINNTLESLPSNTVSFKEFYQTYPNGEVLSRNTGYNFEYGKNPYPNYDSLKNQPLFFKGFINTILPSMERVLGLKINGTNKAYPYNYLRENNIVYDKANNFDYVIFYKENMNSALDSTIIRNSKMIGSTGVFSPYVKDDKLTFKLNNRKEIIDTKTNSVWSLLGKAISGPLKGTKLLPISHSDVFWFAWSSFYPNTTII